MRFGRTREVSDVEALFDHNCSKIIIYTLLILLPIGLYYSEMSWLQKNLAFQEVRRSVEEVNDDYITEHYVGKLVHLTSNSIKIQPQHDPDFNFAVAGALKLKRVTEYCQWREHTEYIEDENKKKYKRYYYVKGWHSTTVPSFLFDQPFGHHNPIRDPYPEREWVAKSATIGVYTATRFLIDKIHGYQFVNFGISDVANFFHTDAAQLHGFKPIGQGYFYSVYHESTSTTFARIAGMFLEGSLDIQLGDLFSTCNAGDLRVSYQQVAPESVSVIGLLESGDGTLTTFRTVGGYEVGLMYPGVWGTQDMFDKELWDTWWEILLVRILVGLLWGFFFNAVIQRDHQIFYVGTLFWGTLISLVIYIIVHGFENLISSAQQYPIIALFVSIPTMILWLHYYNNHKTTPVNPNKEE